MRIRHPTPSASGRGSPATTSRVDGPVAIAGDERAVTEAALATVAGRILYGRSTSRATPPASGR
jgi:hypothetical protein